MLSQSKLSFKEFPETSNYLSHILVSAPEDLSYRPDTFMYSRVSRPNKTRRWMQFCGDLLCNTFTVTLTHENKLLLHPRHKLYKSCGDPPIFRRFLFFGIGRSPPDFLDLEPCRKGQAADVCWPPPGDCSAIARFVPQMT